MITSFLRPTALSVSILAAMAVSAASAETISHETPRQPPLAVAAATTSPVSSMPYTCDKSELGTRIEKRTCR